MEHNMGSSKDKGDKIIIEEEIMERWTKYFEELTGGNNRITEAVEDSSEIKG